MPTPVDRDIGRDAERQRIDALFEAGARAVTLRGPGGVGKTRLAVGWGLQGRRQRLGPVVWCDLAEAEGVDDVEATLRAALGLSGYAGSLPAALARQGELVLLLDNFEQLPTEAADLIRRVLLQAPDVRLLITSRRPLGITQEAVLDVGPLPPAEAATLFRTRACAQRNDFERSAPELALVPELVARLDGLPLAIELTAARIRHLTVHQILERLDRRLELLVRSSWHGSERHRSLQAALDWSWDLLGANERSAWAGLSVLRGSFDLAAAGGVLGGTLDAVGPQVRRLRDRSLLAGPVEGRYRMLVSLRHYARARLSERPGEVEAVGRRHTHWFADRASGLDYFTPNQGRAIADIAPDRENILQAAEASLAAGEPDVAARCVAALGVLGVWSGHIPSSIALLERVLNAPGLSERHRHRLELQRCTSLKRIGRYDEARAGVLRILAAESEPAARVEAHVILGATAWVEGRMEEAEEALTAGLELARNRSIPLGECRCAAQLSRFLPGERGALHAERAIALGAQLDAKPWEAFARMSLGQYLVRREGRHEEGEVHIRRAVELCREDGHTLAEAANLNNLAECLINRGRLAEAEGFLRRSIALHRSGGNFQGEALALANLSTLQWRQGAAEAAERNIDAALALLGGPRNRNHCALQVTKARVVRDLGKVGEALRILDEAAAGATAGDNPIAEGMARCLAARWRAEAGEGSVFQELQAGLEAVDRGRRPVFSGRAALEEAAVLRLRRRPEEAWLALDRAEHHLVRAGDPLGRADVLLARAELLLDRNDRGGAAAALDDAAALLEAAGLVDGAPAGRRLESLRARRPGEPRRAPVGGYEPIDSLVPM